MITLKNLLEIDEQYFSDDEEDSDLTQDDFRYRLATYLFDCDGIEGAFRDDPKHWKKFREVLGDEEVMKVLTGYFNGQHDT